MSRKSYALPVDFRDKTHEAIVSLWWTGSLLRKLSRRMFRSLGSSEAHFNVMLVLRDVPGPLIQSDLSRLLLVDRANVTALLDELQELGLVSRTRARDDRRRYQVVLTPAGSRRLEQLDRAYRQVVRRVMKNLTQEQERQLIALTGKVREGIARTGLGAAGRSRGRRRR